MAEENSLELHVVSPSDEVITPEQSFSDEKRDESSSSQGDGSSAVGILVDSDSDVPQKTDEPKSEAALLDMIEMETYDKVHGRITAKTLMRSDNPLSLAIQVAEKLHQRANQKEPDKYDFINLASRVEEFTLRFLDSLSYHEFDRKMFFNNPETKVLVETAIKFEQKKFFDHPVIIDFLKDSWYGGCYQYELPRRWWFFLSVCCLFDVFIFPLISLLIFVVGIHKTYRAYFEIPCFIFVRDTISYLVLLALHLALSVESSQLSFSALEWVILLFFAGRFLTEMKQIIDFARKPSEHKITGLSLFKAKLKSFIFTYSRDRWNVFDFLTFVVYIFAILPLRIAIWVESESVNNNRILAVAGYLYGVNTMFLTLRAFGSLLETTKGVGTVQIAFFHIIGDAVVVVVHFLAITVAFASTITKVFVAEKTMVSKNTPEKQPVCNKSGIQCWWKIAKHLGWSLLDLSEGLSPLESTDSYSETLAQLLFAAYLIFALILLINMLIALLSNTYQRVQDNSRNEWVFKRAIAVQTYLNYHPIPVPWNVLYIPAVWIYNLICKRKVALKKTSQSNIQVGLKFLLDKYRLKYGDSFPPGNKIDQILDDAENTESMVNQILYRTFTYQKCHEKALLPTGAKAWEAHEAILVDGYLITNQPYEDGDYCRYGARYTKPFSPTFPHFEVMILESGETRWLGIGVVFDHYGTDDMPGWEEGTVGFHTDDSKIFDANHCCVGKKTIGSTASRRGDVIRCTVMFEDKRETDGQIHIPVVFRVNGSKIIPKDDKPSYIKYSMDRPVDLFPYLAFRYENSVLAKMCAREEIDFQGQELTSNIAEVESKLQTKLECVERNLETKLECVQNLETKLECVQRKLDALLEKLGEGERNK